MSINKSYNVTSQFGEDAYIYEIFNKIGDGSKVCVEFGAWDGKFHSNTWDLWANKDWTALLIEGDREKFPSLRESVASFSKVSTINEFVRAEGSSSLDAILDRWKEGVQIDLLSIDIDGDDYHVWKALLKYRPRVVIIEFNPTIPPEIDLVQKKGEYFGSSAGALARLAHEKMYKLFSVTDTNCIFVTNEEFSSLHIEEPNINSIFSRKYLSNIINSYDGRMYLNRNPVYSHQIKNVSSSLLSRMLAHEIFGYDIHRDSPIEEHPLMPIGVIGYPARDRKGPLMIRALKHIKNKLVQRISISQKINPYLLWLKRNKVIRNWNKLGRHVPPPHEVKQGIIERYSKEYRLTTLVETGTYLGDMIEAMRRVFRRIYSIELGEDLWEKANARFAAFPNIKIIQGDSAKVLKKVILELEEPALFWLDGHYSAGITAKGDLETPVFGELEQILSHHIQNHVILIDDARCFNGLNDYPTKDTLREYVVKKRPDMQMVVKDDIIRITFNN